MNPNFTRRRLLRGLGACLALPSLETFLPAKASAAGVATTATGAPQRLAVIYFPNGAIHKHWWPTGNGADFKFGQTLAPLESLRHRIQVMGGLDHRNAEAGNDGAGDHARANGTFLTGVRVKKTAGSDIYAGTSIDQMAAPHLAKSTRFASLELSTDPHRKSGGCDSGYSCAYESGLAWRSPTAPLSPETNPRLVFERMFGAGNREERAASLAKRRAQQRSILDFVMDDAKAIERDLTHRDKAKLDEYLTGVREIEQRITAAESFGPPPDTAVPMPIGIPTAYDEYIRTMFQMMALAFETDSTRIASLILAHDGSNRTFPEINISEGHHSITHHQEVAETMEKVALIDRFYVERFAEFLTILESKHDADGQSVLHNSAIVYGCGNSDGNRHTHHNLPILLAGNGGGTLHPGRFQQYDGKPLCNLFLNLTDNLGIPPLERFGDSTGRLADV